MHNDICILPILALGLQKPTPFYGIRGILALNGEPGKASAGGWGWGGGEWKFRVGRRERDREKGRR